MSLGSRARFILSTDHFLGTKTLGKAQRLILSLALTKRATRFGRWRSGLSLLINGRSTFGRFPVGNGLAYLEWGLNWCVHQYAMRYLITHSATIAKDGYAALLIGTSGAGKSTLCATLVSSGWRLLSDEMALISPGDGQIRATGRPICLKNESIDLIRTRWPEAEFRPLVRGTIKGDIAHIRPPEDSFALRHELARPSWLVFPRFESGADLRVEPAERGRALIRLANESFNYHILGLQGFEVLAKIVRQCQCLEFTYSDSQQAVDFFAGLSPCFDDDAMAVANRALA